MSASPTTDPPEEPINHRFSKSTLQRGPEPLPRRPTSPLHAAYNDDARQKLPVQSRGAHPRFFLFFSPIKTMTAKECPHQPPREAFRKRRARPTIKLSRRLPLYTQRGRREQFNFQLNRDTPRRSVRILHTSGERRQCRHCKSSA